MTEGREHPPTNKHSPPAPTSPFTPGRPIYLSLSLPHTLLRPIFQLFILFPSKSLSPFLISDNGHFGRLMRPVSAVGRSDRTTDGPSPNCPSRARLREKTPIRYSPPRRRRRLSPSSVAAARRRLITLIYLVVSPPPPPSKKSSERGWNGKRKKATNATVGRTECHGSILR